MMEHETMKAAVLVASSAARLDSIFLVKTTKNENGTKFERCQLHHWQNKTGALDSLSAIHQRSLDGIQQSKYNSFAVALLAAFN